MAEKICLGCIEKYSDQYDVCPHCGYVDGTPPKEAYHLVPGTILHGRYIVGKVIGYGGFGVTYIGYDGVFEHKIAIKEYLPGEFATRSLGMTQVTVYTGDRAEQFQGGIEKFVNEAQRLAKFKSTPGVVSVYDSFKENNTAYIIMEYLDGESLKNRLQREGQISVDESLNIILPILSALKEIHKEGILHRDISPDNIFLCSDGQIKLLDFGAARYATSSHSKSLSVIVKPGYAPQEQYRSKGDQGPWTDVYACAATLYKMITGVTPEDSMERGNKDTLVPPSKLGIKIPKNKENAIMNAMNLQIEDRTQTAEAFEDDLITEDDVKRNRIRMKKMDIGRWPLWLKLTSGTVAVAIITVIALLVTGVIDFGDINIFDRGDLEDGKVYVPNVVNYSANDARMMLEEVDLQFIQDDARYSDEIEEGKVLAQSISYGTEVDINTGIRVTLSAGEEPIYMPDLIGEEKDSAINELEELELISSTNEMNSEIAPGYVAEQEYEEDTVLHKGYNVELGISKGIENYDTAKDTTVPTLTGKNWEDARGAIAEARLYIYRSGEEYSNTIPKGEIIEQDVSAGSTVKEGTEIGVVISLGVETARFPLVSLKLIDEVQTMLTEEGFTVTDIVYEQNENVDRDHVTRITLEDGAEVREGDSIRKDQRLIIYISEGNSVATEPDRPDDRNNTEKATSEESTTERSTTERETTESPTTDKPTTERPTTDKPTTEGTTTETSIEEEPTTKEITTEPPTQEPPDDGNISVPNVVGMTQANAKSKLTNSNLTVGTISYKHDESSTNGTVLSQGVASGSKVAKGSSINLVVCNNETYTEYRYRTKETKQSSSSSLSGWTLVDTKTSYSNWSSWSSWSTNAVSSSDTRNVETKTETQYQDNPGYPYPIPTGTISTTNTVPRDDVRWIQKFLAMYFGFDSNYLPTDGIYGGVTIYHVKDFQRDAGLTADGSVGPSTVSAMLYDWQQRTAYTVSYYRYQTRAETKTYYYERWGSWSSWSTTKTTATSNKEVETRTVYKY